MNRGLKHYTKQLTQEVGGASCSVNLNKEDANLHITIPLIKTVGLDPIDLSLIFNLQDFNNDSNKYLFGKGSKLNLFTRYTDTTSKITLLNADGSSDEYLSAQNFYNSETQLTINKVRYTSSQYIYQVKDKYGNQRDFYNGINYPKQIKMKSGAVITTDFQTTQPYLYNGKGDKIQFTVNSTGLTTKLTYLHDNVEVYKTEIEYSNERIYRVKYYNGDTMISSLCLSYGGYGFELVDEITGYRIKYIFSGSKVLHIIPGYESSYTNSPSTSITYEDNKTTITKYNGEKVCCYFDSNQLPLFEIDDVGNVVAEKFDSATKQLLFKTNVVNAKDNADNILLNNDISSFTRSGSIICQSLSNTDEFLSENVGFSVYKFTSTGSGTKTLSYVKNLNGLATDEWSIVLFGKQLTKFTSTTYVKVTLKVDNEIKDERYFTKEILDENFEFMSLGFSATKSYSKIEVIVTIEGNTNIELGGIQVIKKEFGAFYNYDESSNISNIALGGISTNILYNDTNLPNQMISKDSSYNNFEYDEAGNLIKYQTSYGTKMENTYHDSYTSNLIKNTVSNDDESKILEVQNTYTSDGRFVYQKSDELGNITTFDEYDAFGKIKKITDALSNVYEFNYFDNGLLKNMKVINDSDSLNVTYTYDDKTRRLKTIFVPNGTTYEFSYDERGNLIQVKLNGEVIYVYTYDLLTGNILTQKNGINGDGYRFEYDTTDVTQLNTIYYFDSSGVETKHYSFKYDEKKRLKCIFDALGNCLKEHVYDSDGRIKQVTGDFNDVDYRYDNLGNVVAKTSTVSNKKVFTSYDSISRSKGSHPIAFTKGVSGYVGIFDKDSNIYSGSTVINSINHSDTKVSLPISKEGVINYVEVDPTNLLSYKMGNLISPLECGCVQFWFKPNALSVSSDELECLFSTKNPNGAGSIELTAEGGRICLNVVDDSGNEHCLIASDYGINYGKWNFITLNFINRNDGENYNDITEYNMILNKHKQTYYQTNPGLRVSLGTNPVYNIGHKFNGTSSSCYFNGKIAALRIMPRSYSSINDIYDYYYLSKEYIFENQLNEEDVNAVEFSQTNLFTTNSNIYNQFEIYPLQNHVESLNGLKPIKFDLRRVSEMDKDRTFNFNVENKRYAYVADGSQLVYNFGQSTEGTIAMRIYIDEFDFNHYIFQAKDSSSHTIGLFRDDRGELVIDVNGEDYITDFVINSREWVNVALSFSETIVSDSETETNNLNIRVVLNGNTYSTTIAKTFSYGLLDVSIGRKMDYTTETTSFGMRYDYSPLRGQIEMLATSKTYCEISTITTLFEEMKGFTKVHEFDELGMLKKVDLHKVGNSILSSTYEYKTRDNDSRYLSKFVKKETIKTNGLLLTNRNYTYDALGRLTNVTDSRFGSNNYVYDYRGFLVEADGIKYTYDDNGNITSINGDLFVYDENNKDKLVSALGLNVTYDSNSPGLIKSYNGNTFTYKGKRLYSIENSNGLYSYKYDNQGLRLNKYKSTGEYWNYYYDNDKLVTEQNDTCRLDFLYDEYGELYGFIKDNTDKYFYIRDIFKNILGIINSTGSIVVEYRYNPFGVCTSIAGSLASTIGVLNPFRYKGYYYDEETGLAMVGQRYYSPELGRFL